MSCVGSFVEPGVPRRCVPRRSRWSLRFRFSNCYLFFFGDSRIKSTSIIITFSLFAEKNHCWNVTTEVGEEIVIKNTFLRVARKEFGRPWQVRHLRFRSVARCVRTRTLICSRSVRVKTIRWVTSAAFFLEETVELMKVVSQERCNSQPLSMCQRLKFGKRQSG